MPGTLVVRAATLAATSYLVAKYVDRQSDDEAMRAMYNITLAGSAARYVVGSMAASLPTALISLGSLLEPALCAAVSYGLEHSGSAMLDTSYNTSSLLLHAGLEDAAVAWYIQPMIDNALSM